MGKALHTNRAASTLATGINTAVTTCTVATGEGARFPAANTAAGTYFGLVIQDGDLDANLREYCYCTNRTGDVLTIVRAQDGSTAKTFSAGATVAGVILAGELDVLVQKDGDQLTGALDEAALGSIASAATTSIGTVNSNSLQITGSTTISSLGAGVNGMVRECYITNGLTFVNSASLVLPAGVNLTLAAGEWVKFRFQGTAWFCTKAPASVSTAASDNSSRNATTAWAKLGFVVSFGTSNYIKFPDWLGGVVIQWGNQASGASGSAVTFPLTFPNGIGAAYTTPQVAGANFATYQSPSASSMFIQGWNTAGAQVNIAISWLVIGR